MSPKKHSPGCAISTTMTRTRNAAVHFILRRAKITLQFMITYIHIEHVFAHLPTKWPTFPARSGWWMSTVGCSTSLLCLPVSLRCLFLYVRSIVNGSRQWWEVTEFYTAAPWDTSEPRCRFSPRCKFSPYESWNSSSSLASWAILQKETLQAVYCRFQWKFTVRLNIKQRESHAYSTK